jgi:hypothetical protein
LHITGRVKAIQQTSRLILFGYHVEMEWTCCKVHLLCRSRVALDKVKERFVGIFRVYHLLNAWMSCPPNTESNLMVTNHLRTCSSNSAEAMTLMSSPSPESLSPNPSCSSTSSDSCLRYRGTAISSSQGQRSHRLSRQGTQWRAESCDEELINMWGTRWRIEGEERRA